MYFKPYLDGDGIHLPTYEDRMSELLDRYRAIFGQDVYTGEDSPDYQLLSIFAKALDDMGDMMIDVFNSRNPAYAVGQALDILLPMAGISRLPATYSQVMLELEGEAGTTIPKGSIVGDESGNMWEIPEETTFSDGKTNVQAWCTQTGPIKAAAGTITSIQTPAENWVSATNPEDAIPGSSQETDESARIRYNAAMQNTGKSTLEVLRAHLLELQGVESVVIRENSTGSTVDGQEAHSVCCAVKGGSAADIAKCIYLYKGVGVATSGTKTGTYTDENGETYTIHYNEIADVDIYINIYYMEQTGFSETILDQIKNAVVTKVNSLKPTDKLIVATLFADVMSLTDASHPTYVCTSIEGGRVNQSEETIIDPGAFAQIRISPENVHFIEVV